MDDPGPATRTRRGRAAGRARGALRALPALAGGAVPIAAAVGVGAGVERLTGVPGVVAGLVALTAALVASPRLLALAEPAAAVLLRCLPALFVPLCAGIVGVGGPVRAAWPAAVAAVAVSVPVGFVVTARLAAGLAPADADPADPAPGPGPAGGRGGEEA